MATSPGPPGNRPPDWVRQFATAMELPFVLVSGVVIGGGLGWLLDRWLHTSPLCMLILGFLGFGGGVWSVIKTVLRQS